MLYDKIKEYSDSGVYPFHMPGHKRNFTNSDLPYKLDLTEIHGFDNLHNPQGSIKSLEEKAARLFNANKAFVLINGATGGILSAIRTLTNFGDKVIVARNCHKSVYHAIELCGLQPEYFMPDRVVTSEVLDIFGAVNPFSLDTMLDENPDTKLVIITSPTYEGVVSDVEQIAFICHKHGARLLVDEAHGAHFPFSEEFPESAIECGADASVVSLHKTLPSLTQTALLLINDSSLEAKLKENLAVFESSSPSYVLMSSVECCLDFLENSAKAFDEYVENLYSFSEKIKGLKKLKVLFRDEDEEIGNLYDYDLGKLVISTAYTNLSGVQLAEILRSEYKIEVEMAAASYIIAMSSVCDTREGFDGLADALLQIDSQCEKSCFINLSKLFASLPERSFYPIERFKFRSRLTSMKNAEGLVSLEYITAYPPGIPLIVPGEIISKEIIMTVKYLISNGVEVGSSQKNLPDFISVAQI